MPLLRFLLFCVISLSAAAATDMRRPNILWIFAEDLSPYMGCYGDPINAEYTPTIDNFAAQGVLFTRAFSTAPVCSASRSAIITGVMQTSNGTHQHRSSRTTDGVIVPEELRIHLPDGMKTLPEMMRAAGYFTFNSGKDDYNFHYDRGDLYSVGNEDTYKPGMNGWQGNHAKHNLSITEDTWNSRPDKSQPWFGQIEIKGGKANSRWVRPGQELADEEVPLPPYFPDTEAHRKAWTQHYNAVRGSDARVETIMNQLKSDGELENTIVFFFSDHGNNQSLRHKQFCYEGGVHIPLMVKGNHPAIGSGIVRDELVSALDITATTLALGDAEMPDHLDGYDLFSDTYPERSYMISARDRCDYTIDQIRTVRTDRYRYIRNGYPDRAMLQAQYRDNHPTVADLKRLYDAGELSPYLAEHWFGERPREEFYDLTTDPHQIHNLAADPAFETEVVRHRAILDTWIQETGDQGQTQEAAVQLKATYDLWIEREIFSEAKVNPEYDQFR
ncbi:MAG: sulfatase [Opitutaceae bacterium]|jgi:arylsulfatase A-like enzyme|nr:sulfatase [Opitutaceae bacterium]